LKAVILTERQEPDLCSLFGEMPALDFPVANVPYKAYLYSLFKRHGIKEVFVYTEEKHAAGIEERRNGFRVSVFQGPYHRGAAGCLKARERDLAQETCLVMAGNYILDSDLQRMLDFHKKSKALVTVAVAPAGAEHEQGLETVRLSGDHTFLSFHRYFAGDLGTQYFEPFGLYLIEPEIFQYIHAGQYMDFKSHLLPLLFREKKMVCAYPLNGYCRSFNSVADYYRITREILNEKIWKRHIRQHYREIKDRLWVGKNVMIHPEIEASPPVLRISIS